jgi:hypothetical protein
VALSTSDEPWPFSYRGLVRHASPPEKVRQDLVQMPPGVIIIPATLDMSASRRIVNCLPSIGPLLQFRNQDGALSLEVLGPDLYTRATDCGRSVDPGSPAPELTMRQLTMRQLHMARLRACAASPIGTVRLGEGERGQAVVVAVITRGLASL